MGNITNKKHGLIWEIKHEVWRTLLGNYQLLLIQAIC